MIRTLFVFLLLYGLFQFFRRKKNQTKKAKIIDGAESSYITVSEDKAHNEIDNEDDKPHEELFANRYRLIEKVGVGGFSEVWKAADQMAEDSVVAIKIYAPERGMDDAGLKQFRREYVLVMNLNHPNLLTARHFDIWEGRPFLVFPFISGGSLGSTLINHGALDEYSILQMMKQVSGALAYLHNQKILHQDIKPDNILIGENGRYLLSDFGISSRLRSTLRKSTTTGKSMTVAYSPPERFDATPKNLPDGDIFSLGVLCYELATGDVPWMGAGGMSLKTGAEIPELPDTFSIEFRDLIRKMISIDPINRPAAQETVKIVDDMIATGRYSSETYLRFDKTDHVVENNRSRSTQRIDKKN